MTSTEWTRIEGMIIARDLDPALVADELRERGILAQLEWFPASPQLLGLTLAQAEGRLALVNEAGTPEAGPTMADLAEELAVLLDAEVRLGSSAADHLPQGESPLADTFPVETPEEEDPLAGSSRLVEIGRTPASSVPLLAALEGIDLADKEMADGHRALLAVLPPDKIGWNFGDLPLVTLSITDGDFQAFLVTDDHLEHITTHNWGMEKILVAGACAEATAKVTDLVGDRPELLRIGEAVPGADIDALCAAATLKGEAAVREVVAALGLPLDVATFLLGRTEIDEVEGFTLHLARGISTAIGRSVDIMLNDTNKSVHPIFEAYQALALDRPWIVRTAASVEAAIGAGLLVLSLRSPKPRSPWMVAGGVIGGLMVVDSLAEIFLAKYVSRKRGELEG